MFGFKAIVGISISAAFAIPAFAHTEDKKENIEQVVVWGRAFSLAGKAFTASEGIVGYSDLSKRPILRAGELVEVIPGMIATQHSGTGKANQYFLRGFNLDHGTDFAARFEGMPVNMPTHGHGQGYLDLNFIIPEIVEYVSYEKGPYHADVGDFSSAGSAAFKTYDRLGQGFVHASIGNQGYYRLVAADSMNAAGGTLLLAGEAHFYGGPWELDENLEKFNALMKYTGEVGGADTQFIATAYRALWDSTDQVPLRAVDGGLIPRKGFIDPDLGGPDDAAVAQRPDGLGPPGGTGLRHILPSQPVLELHLFPRRPGERRPVRTGRRARHPRRQPVLGERCHAWRHAGYDPGRTRPAL